MKLKNLFVLPMIAGLMLIGGCKNTAPVEPETPIVEPDEPSEPEEPEEPEVPAKTAEEVVADINGVFSGLGIDNLLSWYDEYNCFIGGLSLGAAEHASDEQHAAELQEATEFVVSYLPEYLTQDAAGFEEESDDYYIGLSVDSVAVDNFGYINTSGNIIVQIQVSTISE